MRNYSAAPLILLWKNNNKGRAKPSKKALFNLNCASADVSGVLHDVVRQYLPNLLSKYALQLVTAFFPAVAVQSCWRETVCEPKTASFGGPWDSYIYSPASRMVSPLRILSPNHTVLSLYPGPADLELNRSLLIFDFGQEVGGIITVEYASVGSGSLGLAFSEARNWTGEASDGSNGSYLPGGDGALLTTLPNTTSGVYTVPDLSLRGGFRYLAVFTTTDSRVEVKVKAITLEIAYQPTWSDLRAYGGYFYSSDDLINRI